jgi:cytochrome c oxidase cbb3-type subunit 2
MNTLRERGVMPLATIVGGTALALAIAGLLGAAMPATDVAVGAHAAGKPRTYTEEQVLGRKIYIREGCFTCHTQMVRDTPADNMLGPRASEPGDYGNEAPNLIGLDRWGPDLTCTGDRRRDRAWHVKHLRRPASVRKGSLMPPYEFLTGRELRALAGYLLALRCGE